jgi:7-cyano-7-deazaguanine synthase
MSLKTLVLLSGGLDSTVNLFEAFNAGEILLALTFDYGQKAAGKEIQSAKKLTEKLKVPHQVVPLSFLAGWGGSSLTSKTSEVPKGSEVSIDDLQISTKTAKSVWVPNRNGVFLNIAAGFAESLGAKFVVPGFNKEEATTFPDNSKAFMTALDNSFSYSTANKVQVKCWTVDMDKTEIVKRGIELGVPFEMMWPCYLSLERWCGECESCQRSKRAFAANGLGGLF